MLAFEKIDHIVFGWFVLPEAAGEYAEPAINTLRASSTMSTLPRRFSHAGAADRIRNQVRTAAIGKDLNDVGLGLPHIRIPDGEAVR